MKNKWSFRISGKTIRIVMVMLVLFSATSTYAGPGAVGASGITDAADTIKQYWDPIKILLQAIGAIVGLIGGIRIYNKWVNGDQDVNKEIIGWGGACLFLVIVPTFVGAFFGV